MWRGQHEKQKSRNKNGCAAERFWFLGHRVKSAPFRPSKLNTRQSALLLVFTFIEPFLSAWLLWGSIKFPRQTLPVSNIGKNVSTQNWVIPNLCLRNSVVSRHSPVLNHDRIFEENSYKFCKIRGTSSQDFIYSSTTCGLRLRNKVSKSNHSLLLF